MSQDGPEGKGGKARHGALKADSLSASSERSGFVASFENTVLIRRPIEDVFALLSDFENVPKWNSAIVDTRKLSDGPVGVGTVYQQVRSGSESERRALRGHRLQPPRHLEIRGQLGPFPVGGCCADRASARGSPGVGWTPTGGWADSAGRWSALLLAWLVANRRLSVRYERRADILTAFLHLGY
jgi:hypothetical protein